MTIKSLGSLYVLPATVTWRSSIASSMADWTLAGARFISSANIILPKMGPGSKRNVRIPFSSYSFSLPKISEGTKSGVNWILENLESMISAIVRTVFVLASPGNPSTKILPSASNPMINLSTIRSWPMISSFILCCKTPIASRAVIDIPYLLLLYVYATQSYNFLFS